MNNHKATPEQWKADKHDWSKADTEAMDNDSAFRCILELRARVEALEAQANPTKMVPPPVVTDEELLRVYDDGPGHGFEPAIRAVYNFGVAHGQASSREVAEPAPVAGGLVVRVADAITSETGSQWATTEAHVAILEVATWLRKQGWIGAADLLEQEAGR